MKEKILVLAYPGIGKTYMAENFTNVSDFEFQHYRYDYGKYKDLPLEQIKGRTEIRTDRPEWPQNFFKALEEELEKGRIVLVPFASSLFVVLDYLAKSKGVKVILAIQDKNSFEDIANKFRKRGNSEEFIERRRNDFKRCHDMIEKSNFDSIILMPNEYLSDGLKRLGLNLISGKGIKNYH